MKSLCESGVPPNTSIDFSGSRLPLDTLSSIEDHISFFSPSLLRELLSRGMFREVMAEGILAVTAAAIAHLIPGS